MSTNSGSDQGVVFRKATGHYTVRTAERDIACALSSRLRKQLIYSTTNPNATRHTVQTVRELDHVDPIAIGDAVCFINAGDGSGLITEILPRRNKFSRPATVPGRRFFEQIIAANVDQVVPVFAAVSPPPKWGLLDRYLVAAEAAGLPALICINKIDLATEDTEFHAMLDVYRRIGYAVQLVSATTGEGLADLEHALKGRISVLVGKSGVGKTSLLNALQPGLGQRVKEVSRGELGKGLHTTTHLEMFALDFGGALVDTPGVREFGLWDIAKDELALMFPEMNQFVGHCKFSLGCLHAEEPGCAIRKEVVAGQINPHRYQSYVKLLEEL